MPVSLGNDDASANEPVVVLFKMEHYFSCRDMPTRMTKSEIEAMFRLQDIIKNAQQKITVVEISVHSGHGVQEVIKWIQKAQK